MKKFIFLLFLCMCVTMCTYAGDKVNVTYTKYGCGVELVTTTFYNNRSSTVLYGLRQDGVVIVKDCELAVDNDLKVFVFHDAKRVVVYYYGRGRAKKLAEVKVGSDGTNFHSFEDGKVQIVPFIRNGHSYKTIKFSCTRVSGRALSYYEAYEVELGTFYRLAGETHKVTKGFQW